MFASVRYGEETRMTGMWWQPTSNSHACGIANGGSRCIAVIRDHYDIGFRKSSRIIGICRLTDARQRFMQE